MAAIAEILYVWAKLVNWREARRKRKEMQQYETPSNGFVYFRPVSPKDIPRVQELEAAAYPADEAASAATLEFRATQAPERQRQGIATRMVKAYLVYVQQTCPQIHSVQLICKEELIPLYKAGDFTLLGASSVVHGKSQWFDMIYHISNE